jgi:hypothetical protein
MTTATIENKVTTNAGSEPVVPVTDAPSSVPADSPALQPLETVPGSLPDLGLPAVETTLPSEESDSDAGVESRLKDLATETRILLLKLGKDLEWTRTTSHDGAIVFSNPVEGDSEKGIYSVSVCDGGLLFSYVDDSLHTSTFVKYTTCERETDDNPCAGKVNETCVTSTFLRGLTNHRQFNTVAEEAIEEANRKSHREEHMHELVKAIFEAGFEMGSAREDSPLEDILERVLSNRGSGRAQVKVVRL